MYYDAWTIYASFMLFWTLLSILYYFTFGSINMCVCIRRAVWAFSVPNIDPTVVRGYITGPCGLFIVKVNLDSLPLYRLGEHAS